MNKKLNVSEDYLEYRQQLLDYTNQDMNLDLENDQQIYLSLIDIPLKSNIIGHQTQSLAMLFGLNTNIYHGSGDFKTGLEECNEVKKATMTFFMNCPQVLQYTTITNDIEFYNSEYIRVYLKTSKGIYFKELKDDCKENQFLKMLINKILDQIGQSGKMK